MSNGYYASIISRYYVAMAGRITQNDEERMVNMDGNAVNISTELHACGAEGRSAAFEHEGVNSRVSMDDAINLY